MAHISFSPGTTVPATWLNDVDAAVYTTIPTLAPLISPSFTTPVLGAATATTINKLTFTQPVSGATLTIADGKTLTVSNSITVAGTDGNTITVGAGGGTISGGGSVTGGTNTGDQLVFKTIAVAGQSDIVADTTTDTLTVAAGTGITLTTNAGTDTLTISGTTQGSVILLATLTPTAAATVDFLTTFSSSYDNYLITTEDITPSGSDQLVMRVAVAGVVDTGSTYYSYAASGTGSAVAQAYANITGTAVGKVNLTLNIQNVNSTTGSKSVVALGNLQKDATPTYVATQFNTSYISVTAVSGVRFFWLGGANFTATGKIRIYGISNT